MLVIVVVLLCVFFSLGCSLRSNSPGLCFQWRNRVRWPRALNTGSFLKFCSPYQTRKFSVMKYVEENLIILLFVAPTLVTQLVCFMFPITLFLSSCFVMNCGFVSFNFGNSSFNLYFINGSVTNKLLDGSFFNCYFLIIGFILLILMGLFI